MFERGESARSSFGSVQGQWERYQLSNYRTVPFPLHILTVFVFASERDVWGNSVILGSGR